MNEPSLFELAKIAKHFISQSETVHVLNEIGFKLHAGETVAIVGPSGSGKSTLLGLMAGLERPTSGDILFKGGELLKMNEEALAAWRRQHVGFIFQNFRLIESLTALENVTLPLEILGFDLGQAETRAKALLTEIGMNQRRDHFPSQLSGGEQQRVAIARAYVHNPEIVFADEPTGSLDRETADKVLASLLQFQASKGAALVLVTHDPVVAGRMNRSLTLDHGRIVNGRP